MVTQKCKIAPYDRGIFKPYYRKVLLLSANAHKYGAFTKLKVFFTLKRAGSYRKIAKFTLFDFLVF